MGSDGMARKVKGHPSCLMKRRLVGARARFRRAIVASFLLRGLLPRTVALRSPL